MEPIASNVLCLSITHRLQPRVTDPKCSAPSMFFDTYSRQSLFVFKACLNIENMLQSHYQIGSPYACIEPR